MIEPISHTACETCGSSDAGQIYDDGHFHCHKCGAHKNKGSSLVLDKSSINQDLFLQGTYKPLPARGISQEACELYNYRHADYKGKACTVADVFHRKTGQICAQRVRFPNKEFMWIGDTSNIGLWGLKRFGKGKRVVITEGYEDAMAVSDVFNNKWPVGSVSKGSGGAKKELIDNLEDLDNFDQIVLLFDEDEAGQKAAQECAMVLPAGKALIAHISEKDACDMLAKGKGQELFASIFNAKPYVPDGLVDKEDLLKSVFKVRKASTVRYPFPKLNMMTFGIRPQEIITVAGGSGLGKSTFVRQIANHLIDQKEKVGFITLEEDAEFTLRCLVGQRVQKNARLIPDLNKIPDVKELIEKDILPYTEWYDDQGGLTKARLKSTIEFMALAQGCKYIVYDHITMTDKSEGDTMVEAIDSVMKILRSMAQKHKITIFVVTQLAKPSEGKGYNEGREVKLSNIRGSAAIEFNSNLIIAFQGDNREGGCQRELVILKNRYYGVNTGHADVLYYNPETDLMTTGVNTGEF